MADILLPEHPDANIYGCLPCLKCGSKFRYPTFNTIVCDDCGDVVGLKQDEQNEPQEDQ